MIDRWLTIYELELDSYVYNNGHCLVVKTEDEIDCLVGVACESKVVEIGGGCVCRSDWWRSVTVRCLRTRALIIDDVGWSHLAHVNRNMGQRLARHQVERGLRLYNDQKHDEAVSKWRSSLRKITKDSERFVTLGYLCQAYSDWGKYREMLDFAFQQLDIANEVDSPNMRAEAYLNLARGNERLGDYHKAVSYCRHSIYNYCDESRTTGYVHLCLAHAYLGFSNFFKSIECFDVALKISKEIRDCILEIQAYVGLGCVFGALSDSHKSMRLYGKAYDLVKTVRGSGMYAKFLRIVLVSLSTPLRKLGKMNEAHACCEDAMKMAVRVNDRLIQAQCLQGFADIYRSKNDVDVSIMHIRPNISVEKSQQWGSVTQMLKALSQHIDLEERLMRRAYSTYESAFGLLTDIGDKSGQMQVLAGMAKTLSVMTRLGRVCDCKALEVNNKVLELATSLGNKMSIYHCHCRMQDIYRCLGDVENEEEEEELAQSVFREMELACAICEREYGAATNQHLEVLPCCHVFHAQCVQDLLKECEREHVQRMCPVCSKSLDSRTFLVTYEELESNCPYTLFLDDPL